MAEAQKLKFKQALLQALIYNKTLPRVKSLREKSDANPLIPTVNMMPDNDKQIRAFPSNTPLPCEKIWYDKPPKKSDFLTALILQVGDKECLINNKPLGRQGD